MSLRVAGVVAASSALMLLAGSTDAGIYIPPPGDRAPSWSPDGRRVAFLTNRDGSGVKAVSASGGRESWIVRGPVSGYAISPDWSRIAYQARGELIVARLDGSEQRSLASRPGLASWAPDSRRLAFTGPDGRIHLVEVGSFEAPRPLVEGFDPVWSPDGTRIAYVAGEPGEYPSTDVRIVNADGSGDVNLTPDDPRPNYAPAWSPDGSRIAFLTQWKRLYLTVADLDPAGRRRGYILPGSGPFAWTPDGSGVVYTLQHEGSGHLVRFDLATGRERRLLGPTLEPSYVDEGGPAFSANGRFLAFAAGRECRDRVGIFVVRTSTYLAPRRISNSCRIFGTPSDDVLRGTPLADVLVGLGGDDRLQAVGTAYVGDSLRGGNGADELRGGHESDTLEGGHGDDHIFGGKSADTLVGGPGRDRISGQAGPDLVYARDGKRDIVSCGPNPPKAPDEVVADRVDRVARDCELVRRR